MSFGWEGNHRSGFALATRHRFQWFIHLRAQGLSKEDEHPTYTFFFSTCPTVEDIKQFCDSSVSLPVCPMYIAQQEAQQLLGVADRTAP